MAQKNIKDVKDTKKDVKKKEVKEKKVEPKKDIKKEVKHEVKQEHKVESKVPATKKIQLSPQDAYKLFNEEKRKIESIAKDIENTESALLEFDKTIFALKDIKDAKEKEVMVNIGMGLYFKAKLEDNKKVLAVSAGKAVISKDPAKVLEQLTKKKANALNSLKKLQALHMQTQQNITQLYKFLSAHEQRMKQNKQ